MAFKTYKTVQTTGMGPIAPDGVDLDPDPTLSRRKNKIRKRIQPSKNLPNKITSYFFSHIKANIIVNYNLDFA